MPQANEPDRYTKRLAKWISFLTILSLFLIFSLILAISIGPIQISLSDVFFTIVKKLLGSQAGGNPESIKETVIIELRLPRALLAALAGLALSVAGTVFQCIFRNPLADPYVLGVASGAGFGASLVIFLGIDLLLGSIYVIPLFSSIMAILTVFLVHLIAGGGTELRLLLAGMAVSSFFSSLMSILLDLAGPRAHGVFDWIFGGFPLTGWEYVNVALLAVPLSLLIFIFARDLNILLLGYEQAKQLGVEVERLRKHMMIVSSVLTAVIISICGIIGFVGLVVPHMMRIIVGSDHRILLPSSALAGASILVLCDTVARNVLRPVVIPTGVITALLGAPFFVYLLHKGVR